MKEVEKGETLPKGWRWAQLGDLLSEVQPGFASSERADDGIVQLRMNNVTTDGSLDWSSTLRVPRDIDQVSRFALRPGDIVFNNTNSAELVGKTALIKELSETTVYSNHFTRLRCMARIEPRFIAYWLQFAWRRKIFEDGCDRWVGQAGFQRKKLVALGLSLPPFSEQRRIADLLDATMMQQASARVAAREMADRMDRVRAEAFARLLRAGEWPTKPLLEVCHGKGQYGLSLKAHREPCGTPMLRMGNIQGGNLDWSDLTYVDLDEVTFREYAIKLGDILFNRTNSAELVGKCAAVRQERSAVFASYLVRFRANNEIMNSEFLTEIINGPLGRTYVARHMGRAIGQVNISAGKMHDFPVPCPPIQDQHRIMAAITEIGRLTNQAVGALSAQSTAIDALPGALLSAAFRGDL